MTAFSIIAAFLAALALAFVLVPLVRWRRAHTETSRTEANASIYLEQIAELEAERERGSIGQEEFARARGEIERRVVVEHSGLESQRKFSRVRPQVAALIVGLLVPIFAGVAYWRLGEPRALDPHASRQIAPHQIEAVVERLAVRLQQTPEDVEGWSLLGRSLFVLGRHDDATRAFARALQLAPQDHALLGELLQAIALAGQDRFQNRDYAGAVGYWERILRFAPPDSELAKVVSESIAEARSLGGLPATAAAALQGVVSLDPAVAAKASKNDTVFVLARPVSGSRMPLAIMRTTVEKLPFRFALDDSMAMAPGATISSHAQVVVIARVSKSGTAMAQKGDLEGASAPVAPGATRVAVVISRVVE